MKISKIIKNTWLYNLILNNLNLIPYSFIIIIITITLLYIWQIIYYIINTANLIIIASYKSVNDINSNQCIYKFINN